VLTSLPYAAIGLHSIRLVGTLSSPAALSFNTSLPLLHQLAAPSTFSPCIIIEKDDQAGPAMQ
jgi:hypothetical protein